MAVEIKELVIKAVIAPEGGADASAYEKAASGSAARGGLDQQALIQACVEQVLKILKKEKNR